MATVPKLNRPRLPADLSRLARRVDVHRMVFIEVDAAHASWTEAQLAPYIARAISSFGHDRVMFDGDWPVSGLATSHKHWVDPVDDITAKAFPPERRKLFRENAISFYRPRN